MAAYTIRERERRNASPKEGLRQVWTEVQVMEGRRVVYRCDLIEQAERWIAAVARAEGRG